MKTEIKKTCKKEAVINVGDAFRINTNNAEVYQRISDCEGEKVVGSREYAKLYCIQLATSKIYYIDKHSKLIKMMPVSVNDGVVIFKDVE